MSSISTCLASDTHVLMRKKIQFPKKCVCQKFLTCRGMFQKVYHFQIVGKKPDDSNFPETTCINDLLNFSKSCSTTSTYFRISINLHIDSVLFRSEPVYGEKTFYARAALLRVQTLEKLLKR